ncbi:Hint domain-containing protein [Thioclava indica]|uniref:Hedgehog/Intein (Hint) domain-containing protein n=1 Tax=Thioclava indica TaxID=1353528 RepID=A0A074JD59_9RHOB|nr:Hint domain-containing protein [Thioclava indica]KEO53543.1 hypothetical protein DT23_18325 [Thioclava indica]
MATISVYDVNDIDIIDLATGVEPSTNPLTAQEDGLALNNEMAWPFDGFAITLGSTTTDINFNDNDGILSDDPVSGATLIDQQLTSDVSIAGNTYIANAETTLWQDPAPVYVQNEYEVPVIGPDGTEYTMVAVSIGEGYSFTVVGVTFDGPAPPAGTTLTYEYNSAITNNTSSEIVSVPCFTRGTFIETNRGSLRIESLRKGDLLQTRDHGLQEVIWVGSKKLNLTAQTDQMRPIVLRRGCLGANLPCRDVRVSPAHRILVSGAHVELLFGEFEVLIAAKHLLDLGGVERDLGATEIEYFHILFDQHEIVQTSNMASESFHPGQIGISALDADVRNEIFSLFPELKRYGFARYGSTARMTLKKHEAELFCFEESKIYAA